MQEAPADDIGVIAGALYLLMLQSVGDLRARRQLLPQGGRRMSRRTLLGWRVAVFQAPSGDAEALATTPGLTKPLVDAAVLPTKLP